MTVAEQDTATHCQLLLEITIAASRERVWEALVENTAAWWHKDFFTSSDAKGFHMQPRLGGWMFEDWGAGEGQIWGTVSGVRAPTMLQVVGDSSPDFGGPNRGIMSWNLSPVDGDDSHTVVRFRHALHGAVSEATRTSLAGGWRLLFEDCLKPFAESGKRPLAADAESDPCGA